MGMKIIAILVEIVEAQNNLESIQNIIVKCKNIQIKKILLDKLLMTNLLINPKINSKKNKKNSIF